MYVNVSIVIFTGLFSIFGEDGYQVTSSDQKESQPNKNVEIHTITVSVFLST